MNFIRKNIIKITFFVVFIFIISVIVIKNNLKNNEVYASNDNEVLYKKNIILDKKDNESKETYFVDIKGQVLNPGVYKVYENTRVIDVINMAGGLLDDSDTSKINLAKKIKDEMVIIIYSKDEINKNNIKEIKIDYSFNDALINDSDVITNDNIVSSDSNSSLNDKNILVNINTCTKDDLLTLSGIGESKADAIISYREENGSFKTIEDILNVSGIGNSIYEKIKNYITT